MEISIEHYNKMAERLTELEYELSESVQVVRCKDCKWYKHIGCAIRIVDDSDKPKDNDYCSFGERKGGDDK